jgi:hypothetical protein
MPTNAKPGVDIFAQRLAEDPYAPRVPDWGRGQSSSVSKGLSCLVLCSHGSLLLCCLVFVLSRLMLHCVMFVLSCLILSYRVVLCQCGVV